MCVALTLEMKGQTVRQTDIQTDTDNTYASKPSVDLLYAVQEKRNKRA